MFSTHKKYIKSVHLKQLYIRYKSLVEKPENRECYYFVRSKFLIEKPVLIKYQNKKHDKLFIDYF